MVVNRLGQTWPMTDSPGIPRRLMEVLKGADLVERNRLIAERNRVTGERDELSAQRAELWAQRDDLTAQRAELWAQRDELTAQRAELWTQRDELTAHRDELTAHLDELTAQRDKFRAQRDQMMTQRDKMLAERDALAAERRLQALTTKAASSLNDRMDASLAILLDGRLSGSKIFYLDLMEATLTGSLCEDPPLPTFGDTVYVSNLRDRGLDWPAHAYSMIGSERMRNFRTLIENVIKAKIPGDVVETGVWRGGASIMARAVLAAHDARDRKVIVADSFEGLPPPDGSQFPADAGSAFHQFPELAVSLEDVKGNFERFGLLDEQVVFAKGWFKDTMPTLPTRKIAVLRLDGDMYESTIQPLEHLYDRISPGGWIIVDDYEIIPACKAAVTDFLAERGLNPTIVPIDGVGVYFQKEHKDNWDEWPEWEGDGTFRSPRFNYSLSVSDYSGKTDLDTVALLKDKRLINIYRDLFRNNSIKSIFEIGFFQGGMPLFLTDMNQLDKIVAVDWFRPTDKLKALIEREGLSDAIKLYGDVDQADTERLRSILDEEFGDKPLDLIIDDCSHYLAQTKACFQALFGYLRPGGKYIIEDWGWTHWPGEPWQTDKSPFHGMESMTNLIFELVMAMASDRSLISQIDVADRACVIVTRGPALPPKAPIDLRAMTNIAGGRTTKLIETPAPPPQA